MSCQNRISGFEDRWMEIAYSEKERKKLMKKNREPQGKVEYYY